MELAKVGTTGRELCIKSVEKGTLKGMESARSLQPIWAVSMVILIFLSFVILSAPQNVSMLYRGHHNPKRLGTTVLNLIWTGEIPHLQFTSARVVATSRHTHKV